MKNTSADGTAKERELSLARSAAALRSAFQIAQVGAWEVDFTTRRTLFSDELCELLDVSPLPSMPTAEANSFWVPEDRAGFQEALDRVERNGDRLTFEGRTLAKDGSIRWWRLFGEPVLVANRCVALRGAGQDITAWRGALEREQTAVRTADAMLAFLATMSHELRTPLNGVLGMVHAMERGALDEAQRRELGFIRASGQSLLSQLNDLLDMSKLGAGQVELESGVVDVQALADSALACFIHIVDDKDLSLELRVATSARGSWAGDPARVAQILTNLIANAVKFTEHGAIIVDISDGAAGLVLRVADTGVGIRPDNLASVFERFMQADASTTRRYGGLGLGLTICRDLVRLMKGEIRVESMGGMGAAFAVRLPLARSEAPALAATPHVGSDPLATSLGLKVLAAEDNPINQIVLKTLLGAIGVEPTMVANGREALNAWQDGDFDIVLMDIQMPILDGIGAAKLIREGEILQRRRRTPIIAVTASVLDGQKAAYYAAGIDATVGKPIHFATLVNTIDAVLAPVQLPEARMSG